MKIDIKQEVEVLLVEDNASDAEMTIRSLKKNNMGDKVLHVKDGAEALDFLFAQGIYSGRSLSLVPKVILLDLKMPNVNGIDVLLRIKEDERTRSIPVVMLTSSKADPDIRECYRLGVNGYVVKPIDFEAFHKAISELGLYWLIVNESIRADAVEPKTDFPPKKYAMMNQEIDVLLVEDNPSDAEMTIRALKKSNLASGLLHVRDGAEALDFLFAEGAYSGRAPNQLPKVILLDLKMPRINGKEVLIKIKSDERTKKIPVVVLTASMHDPDLQVCYGLGINGYVVKPVDFDAFQKSIAEIGLYWMIVSQPPK